MQLQTLARAINVSQARTEKFLLELANMVPGPNAALRILERYEDYLPTELFAGKGAGESLRERLELEVKNLTTHKNADSILAIFIYSRNFIRPAWEASSPDVALWILFVLRLFHKELTNPDAPLEPPQLNPFDFSLLLLIQRIGTRAALVCKNPDCPSPYFFVKRKGQEYCSTDCSNDAQREIKRRWWNEKGKKLRSQARKGRTK